MERRQQPEETLEWSTLEYEHKEKSADWFWALAIIIIASSITSIIYSNYFFATLLILSGVLLAAFANKKPEMIHYQLSNKGLRIQSRLYPYENIKSFWVQADLTGETNTKPLLFIKTQRLFMPIVYVPIENEWAEDIHAIMLSKNIPELEMKEHPSEKIMESLGF